MAVWQSRITNWQTSSNRPVRVVSLLLALHQVVLCCTKYAPAPPIICTSWLLHQSWTPLHFYAESSGAAMHAWGMWNVYELSGIHFASKFYQFSSVCICGTMSLFTGIGRTLAAFEFRRNTKFYESKRRLVLFTDECKNGTRAIDDEGDASGTTFVRELTRQQSVRTTDRKVALHTNFLRDI